MTTSENQPENIQLLTLSNFPLVSASDDLYTLIKNSCIENNIELENNDVVVLAQKIVSKSENRFRHLSKVTPSEEAINLAKKTDKDPRMVELILQESKSIIRSKPGLIIAEHKNGYISANAGIDQSNVQSNAGDEIVLLLPEDANRSAKQLRESFKKNLDINVSIVINDSFGRPWRMGSCGIALGSAGFKAFHDMRNKPDLFGRLLQVTEVAVADEIAAAASLVMGQANEARPVVIIKGLTLEHSETHDCSELIRDKTHDLFR